MSYDTTIAGTAGLLAFWPLNDTAGSPTAADASGGGHALTNSGTTLGSTTLTGDGETSDLSGGGATALGNGSVAIPSGAYTIEWVGATTLAGTFAIALTTGAGYWFGVGGPQMSAFGGGSIQNSVGVPANDGNPHHYAVAVTSGGAATFYFDGAAVGTATLGTSPGTGVTVANLIGAFPWSGRLAKVAVYSVALSAATVLAHAQLAFTPATKGVAVTDPNITWSPYNWLPGSGYKQTINSGAWLAAGVTGTTTVQVAIDLSSMPGGTPANQYPVAYGRIDNGAWQTQQLSAGQGSVYLSFHLSTSAHRIEFGLVALDGNVPRWSGANSVKVTSLVIDSGGATAAIPSNVPPPGNMLACGDSTSEGAWALAPPSSTTYALGADARSVSWQSVAKALGCKLGLVAFGGQDWDDVVFNGDIPSFYLTWDHYFSGQSRLVAGQLSPLPDYVAIEFGANGANATRVQSTLAGLRAAAGPGAKILVFVAMDGGGRPDVAGGFAAYQSATPDPACYLFDRGVVDGFGYGGVFGTPTDYTQDGIHQQLYGQAARAGIDTGLILSALRPLLGVLKPGSDTLTLGTARSRTVLTRNATTKALTDADSTPTVTVLRNGSPAGVSVTVTRVGTGQYQYGYPTAGFAAGDAIQETATATVGGAGVPKTVTFRVGGAVAVQESLTVISESLQVTAG